MISDPNTQPMTPEEEAEMDEYILSMGPRFYGPDFDDETGPWYWETEWEPLIRKLVSVHLHRVVV